MMEKIKEDKQLNRLAKVLAVLIIIFAVVVIISLEQLPLLMIKIIMGFFSVCLLILLYFSETWRRLTRESINLGIDISTLENKTFKKWTKK